jgi:membrane-bound acyltransferase YfiQ involved in biofilm formation
MNSRVRAYLSRNHFAAFLQREDMDSVLNSLVVTGVFLVIAAGVGIRLGRSGKPYGFVKLAIHIVLFLLVLSGVVASLYKVQAITDAGFYPKLFLYVALLALLTNVAVGITMIVGKRTNPNMIVTHKVSTFIMALSLVAGFIFAASGI